MNRVRLSSAVALASSLCVSSAAAHGGMWRANRIHIAPDDPSRIILQSDLRGPVFSNDGGKSFRWICAETYGRSSISAAKVAMLMRPEGRLFVASYGRGLQMTDDAPCTFTPAPGTEARSVRDITAVGDRLIALGTVESESAVRDTLLISDDGVAPLRARGVPLPEAFSATSLRARGKHIYVAGLHERGWNVAHTEDDGTTWQFGEVVPFESMVGWSPTIVQVGDSPNLLLVLRDETEWNVEAPSGDALFLSEDGLTFRQIFANTRPLHGVARSPDEQTLLVGGERGLFRASLEGVRQRGQDAFEQLADTPFYGLSWTDAGIYAGTEEFASTDADAFSLGFSTDGGKTFSRRMSLCDTAPYECPADSSFNQLCPAVYSDNWTTGGGFKEDFLESDRCTAPASTPGATGN